MWALREGSGRRTTQKGVVAGPSWEPGRRTLSECYASTHELCCAAEWFVKGYFQTGQRRMLLYSLSTGSALCVSVGGCVISCQAAVGMASTIAVTADLQHLGKAQDLCVHALMSPS